jgi:hypothetical protein
MVRLCVQLSGGLGNQMFQYAAARSLALQCDAECLLDPLSGFIRDKQYKRRFELARLPIKRNTVGIGDQIRLWVYRTNAKVSRLTRQIYDTHWYGEFINETQFKFHASVSEQKLTGHTWLLGYWQSPKYFDLYAAQIRQELQPPEPSNISFTSLAALIDSSESVALGVRLYEESDDPSAHALAGKVKTIDDVNSAIARLRAARPTARFYVFCTHRAEALNKLDLPIDTVFVTADDGYDDAVDSLWLLTRCKHHIFTNSSYYWWGAWLSHAIHKKEEQLIYAADNFINVDGLCDHWHRF